MADCMGITYPCLPEGVEVGECPRLCAPLWGRHQERDWYSLLDQVGAAGRVFGV